MAYWLPRLLNEYLEFSGVNGFVSMTFKKQLFPRKIRLTATLRNQACTGLRLVCAWFNSILNDLHFWFPPR